MHGEFIGVWTEMWREVWFPLSDEPLGADDQSVPGDVFCELYREIAGALRAQPSIEGLADIIDDPSQSRAAFEEIAAADLAGEQALVTFLEAAHPILDDLGGDELANRYFNLLNAFVERFSLRYELRRPCILCPTLPGLFASLVRELDVLGTADENVARRSRDFKEAVQDLRYGPTEGRIANCLAKHVMFLEAIAVGSGAAAGADLAALCRTLDDWPHPAVRQSLLNLYGFASDFPGLRHGTPSVGMRRGIDMRDMVAMSILLTGFTPYLERRLSAEAVFGGGADQSVVVRPAESPGTGSVGAPVMTPRLADLLRRLAVWRRGR
jgi:hypothetical protein